jgi:hypothetical protein
VFALLAVPAAAWAVHRSRRYPRERPWWIGLAVVAGAVGIAGGVAESDPVLGLAWGASGFADIALLYALVLLFQRRLVGVR